MKHVIQRKYVAELICIKISGKEISAEIRKEKREAERR